MVHARRVILLLLAITGMAALLAAVRSVRPGDQASIQWLRNWERAEQQARETGRPLLVLFRDVRRSSPLTEGDLLSHPILVDAANHEFVPVANVARPERVTPEAELGFFGADGRLLTVATGADVTAGRVLGRMAAALAAAGRPVPAYLALVAAEYDPPARETATFDVTCYWKGERVLGALDGVIATRTGTLGGAEVVEVDFDPGRVDYATIARKVASVPCFRKAVAHDDAQLAAAREITTHASARRPGESIDASNQQQYHLWLHKAWHYVPLTNLQATRINAALLQRESPERYLSPTQLAIHLRLKAIHDRDYRALDPLDALTVVRSPAGLGRYARELTHRVAALE